MTEEGTLICTYFTLWASDEINRLWKKAWKDGKEEITKFSEQDILPIILMIRKELRGKSNLSEKELLLVINPRSKQLKY